MATKKQPAPTRRTSLFPKPRPQIQATQAAAQNIAITRNASEIKVAAGSASGLMTTTNVVAVNNAVAPAAGQVLTATGTGAAAWATPGGWTTVAKTTTETIQSDIVLGNDAALLVSLAASTTYRVRCVIFFIGDAAADFQYDFSHTSAPTRESYTARHSTGGGAPVDFVTTSGPPSSVFLAAAPLLPGLVRFDAVIVTNAATVFSFRWAQAASTAADTSVQAGSYLEYAVVA